MIYVNPKFQSGKAKAILENTKFSNIAFNYLLINKKTQKR